MKKSGPILIGIIESRLDPEESLKKIDHKIKGMEDATTRSQSKIEKYLTQKAKNIDLKKGLEMFDKEWADILLIFSMRSEELHGKDRKFDAKAKKIISSFMARFLMPSTGEKVDASLLGPMQPLNMSINPSILSARTIGISSSPYLTFRQRCSALASRLHAQPATPAAATIRPDVLATPQTPTSAYFPSLAEGRRVPEHSSPEAEAARRETQASAQVEGERRREEGETRDEDGGL